MPDAGEITKRVRTVYDVDGLTQAGRRVSALRARLDHLGRTFDRVGKIALGFGAVGVVGLAKNLLDVGKNAEDAKLRLTGLLQATSKTANLGFAGFERASAAAAQLRAEMIKTAQASPVTFGAIQESFEGVGQDAANAGLTAREQVGLARDIAIADLSNKSKGTAAFDIRQLMNGIGSPRQINTAVLKPIAQAAAKAAKSGDIAKAMGLIRKQLAPDPKLLEAYGKSFSGLTSTMSDRVMMLKERAAKPVMEYVSKKLKEWLEWLDKNKAKAEQIARAIGNGVVSGLKAVVGLARWLADHWETVLTTVKTLTVVWLSGRMFTSLKSLVGLAASFAASMRAGAVASGAANAAGAAGAVGSVARGGIGGKLLKAIPWVGAAITAYEVGSALFGSSDMSSADARPMVEEWLGLSKAASGDGMESLLDGKVDPTNRRPGGGNGTKKIRKLVVERAEFMERDFAALSTPAVASAMMRQRATRPLAGLGLGAAAVGVGG